MELGTKTLLLLFACLTLVAMVTAVPVDEYEDDDEDDLMSISQEDSKVKLTTYDGDEGVPHRYIVNLKNVNRRKMKNHMSDVQIKLNSMAASRSTIMGSRISDLKKSGNKQYYVIECSRSAIEAIRSNTDVIKNIEQDVYVRVSQDNCSCSTPAPITTQPPSGQCGDYDASHSALWGLDRIDSDENQRDNRLRVLGDGSDVDVYVIDTGIDVNHPDFEGRAKWGHNAAEGFDDIDGHGHGTHVAGTVGGKTYGVARNANLYAVKVLSDEGWGYNSWILEGMEWVRQRAASSGRKSVVNMSLGGGKSQATNQAVSSLVDEGVVVVVAAGNSNANACKFSPASANKAITVAASNNLDQRASFSNKGKCVDIFAPGQGVLSAQPNGRTAVFSGTSMASPHVAGAAAAYMSSVASHPTPAQVLEYLVDNGTKNKLSRVNRVTPNLLLNVGRQCSV